MTKRKKSEEDEELTHGAEMERAYRSTRAGEALSTAERGEGEAASLEVPTQEVSLEAQGGAVTFPEMPSSATVESELRAEVERLHVEVASLQKRVAGFRARRRR